MSIQWFRDQVRLVDMLCTRPHKRKRTRQGQAEVSYVYERIPTPEDCKPVAATSTTSRRHDNQTPPDTTHRSVTMATGRRTVGTYLTPQPQEPPTRDTDGGATWRRPRVSQRLVTLETAAAVHRDMCLRSDDVMRLHNTPTGRPHRPAPEGASAQSDYGTMVTARDVTVPDKVKVSGLVSGEELGAGQLEDMKAGVEKCDAQDSDVMSTAVSSCRGKRRSQSAKTRSGKKQRRTHPRTDQTDDDKENSQTPVTSPTLAGMESITVLVKKSSSGFGFTVKGSCPVEVGRVDPKSPAEFAGLRPGDLLFRINGQNVQQASAQSVAGFVRRADRYIVLDIQRACDVTKPDTTPASHVSTRRTSHVTPREKMDMLDLSPIGRCGRQRALPASPVSEDEGVSEGEQGLATVDLQHLNTAQLSFSGEEDYLLSTRRDEAVIRPLAVSKLLDCVAQFVTQMRSGVQRFSRPLRHRILTSQEHAALFQNVEKLVAINEFLLRQLGGSTSGRKAKPANQNVGDVFSAKLTLLVDAYESYIRGLQTAIGLLIELKDCGDFQAFLQETETQQEGLYENQSVIALNVDEFVYRPAQHLKELVVHLQAVRAVTSTAQDDYSALSAVTDSLVQCYNRIREFFAQSTDCGHPDDRGDVARRWDSEDALGSGSSSRDSSNRSHMSAVSSASVDTEVLEIQSRLLFPQHITSFHLAISGRHVIYSGEVLIHLEEKVCKKIWMVLFSDLILLCEIEPDKYLTVVQEPVLLQDLQHAQFNLEHDCDFTLTATSSISSSRDSRDRLEFALRAPSVEYKYTWKNILEQRCAICRTQRELMVGRGSDLII